MPDGKHFVAYHNTDKMGELDHAAGLRRLSVRYRKNLREVVGATVWLVSYTKDGAEREYGLAGKFQVDDAVKTPDDEFAIEASGIGRCYWPQVSIPEWLPELRRITGNFAFGLCEIKNQNVVEGLIQAVTDAGYEG